MIQKIEKPVLKQYLQIIYEKMHFKDAYYILV